MNNEFCQTSNVYKTYCNYNNRYCNNGCTYNNQQTSCCHRPQTQCCQQTTVRVGSTVTGDPNTSAIVTNSGTDTNVVLDFVIPRGVNGAPGTQGPAGVQGPIGPIGPAGPAGANGTDGTAATITVGTTTSGEPGTEASVTNVGTDTAAILNFVIPRGEDGVQGPIGPIGPAGPAGANGADGAAATITVGTTTTGAPGTDASVTNVGTENAAILNFVIPAGEPATITPGVAVPLLDATATLDDVIITINNLITSLTNAGFLA